MGVDQPRITTQTLKVLDVLMSPSEDGISGAEITRSTKLASGTLYPILFRLEEAGWVESHWETEDPHELGRPRRRFYRITGVGARKARAEFRDIAPSFKEFAWRGLRVLGYLFSASLLLRYRASWSRR
jgi:PadR family transcriptional regulator, regulatory protein PadR